MNFMDLFQLKKWLKKKRDKSSNIDQKMINKSKNRKKK